MTKPLQLLTFLMILPSIFLFSSPSNLLTNAGGENGVITPFYTYASGPALQITNTLSHSGSYCFLSTNRTQYYHGTAYDIKSLVTGGQLVSGERYTFSVWVRHGEASNKNLHLNIKKKDGSGTKYISLENESVPPNTWVKIVKHYTLAITGTLSTIELYVTSDNSTTFDFYTDDFFVGELEAYTPPTTSVSTDFVRASGSDLVVGAGNTPLLVRGINLFLPTDASDDAEDIWDVKSIAQEDFDDIAAFGFDAIRLTMNYKIFEDDASPGVFKADGWHWLDRVIELAKAANLRVLLDMHAPQGGYQSDKAQGFSAFWGTSDADANTTNQNRLLALWTAIADRYQHETAVLGFDLINEPRPHNSEEWYVFAEQIIAAIRTVDTKHLIWLEVPLISYTLRVVNDANNNLLYDAHFYSPWEYTIQHSSSYGEGAWGEYDPLDPVYVKYVGGNLTVVAQGTSGAEAFDKSYLQNNLMNDLLDFADTEGVPAAVGEYGLCYEMFDSAVGALDYMTDITAVFDGDNPASRAVHRFYFSYHGSPFSIYTNWNGFQRNTTNYNDDLANFFLNYTAPLPVELSHWSGRCNDAADVVLNWQTASESNNAYFTVWRSFDGKNWETLGQKAGNGTTFSPHQYTFNDPSPRSQVAYYRLQQTDEDGQSSFSSILTVTPCRATESLSVFPNPSDNGIFYFKNLPAGLQKITVLTPIGKVVFQNDSPTEVLDLSKFPKGVYLINFEGDFQKISRRVILE